MKGLGSEVGKGCAEKERRRRNMERRSLFDQLAQVFVVVACKAKINGSSVIRKDI